MGQTRTSSLRAARPLPPSADIGPGGQSVGQAAQFCLAAIGLVPVRPGGSFARRPQEAAYVDILYQPARIGRNGERCILEPTPKPSPQSKLVEPQRRLHERLEKPLALRRVEPRPGLHQRLSQINAPHLANL